MTMMDSIRTYSELSKLKTFEERFEYLRLSGAVGAATFGSDRYLNQMLYTSRRWKSIREQVIIRDQACDLGIEDRAILTKILIHHMNPITVDDILKGSDLVFNPEYLICTQHITHNAIHYGDESLLIKSKPVERRPNDTCPWR